MHPLTVACGPILQLHKTELFIEKASSRDMTTSSVVVQSAAILILGRSAADDFTRPRKAKNSALKACAEGGAMNRKALQRGQWGDRQDVKRRRRVSPLEREAIGTVSSAPEPLADLFSGILCVGVTWNTVICLFVLKQPWNSERKVVKEQFRMAPARSPAEPHVAASVPPSLSLAAAFLIASFFLSSDRATSFHAYHALICRSLMTIFLWRCQKVAASLLRSRFYSSQVSADGAPLLHALLAGSEL
uniref:Creatinase_N domain-containing protein n=1 Tax=Steinernema glaseri TaxID=37863 RepID=A0A1I7YI72_9BILA